MSGVCGAHLLFYQQTGQLSSLWSRGWLAQGALSGRLSEGDRLHPLLPARLRRPPAEPQVEQLHHRVPLLLPLLHLPVHKAGAPSPVLQPGEPAGRGNCPRLAKGERASKGCSSAVSLIVETGEATWSVLACHRAGDLRGLPRQPGGTEVCQLSGHDCL